MKLLKLVFITSIFLQAAAIAYPASNKIVYRFTNIGSDTLKHKRKHAPIPPPPPLSEAQYLKELPYNDCIFVKKYSAAQRLKQYPFSKAVKILAVSYPLCCPNQIISIDSNKSDTIDMLKFGLRVTNGVLSTKSLIEIRTLNKQQINYLTNILYNTTYKRKNNIISAGYSCYNPRNAIVFFDKNGKVFDYLSVCFECNQMESLSGSIWFKSNCNQQLDYLKKLFIDADIKYGTLKK